MCKIIDTIYFEPKLANYVFYTNYLPKKKIGRGILNWLFNQLEHIKVL